MPKYRLLVNHHTIEKIEIEAKSPKDARRKAEAWDWEEKDVIKSIDGAVDFVELLNDKGELDFESEIEEEEEDEDDE